MTRIYEPAAYVYRGEGLEAIHHASVAVVGANGELTHYLGDPNEAFMSRSSIKPFQLIPLITSGAADHFGFSDEQLAIMCGSHNGTDRHREIVLSNLNLAGNNSDMLKCGCHWPLGMHASGVYPENNEDKDPTRHNCSGKHSGFLALAKFLGVNVEDYINPNSKSQRMVKQALADYCEYDSDKMDYGIDGCSAPNYSLPLKNLALGFKKLVCEEGRDEKEEAAASRIKLAMLKFPFMVSGKNRFDFEIKNSFPNNCICKIGAEAVEAFGFSEQEIGVAVKIHDGNWRALWPVCIEVLKQIRIIDNIDKSPLLKRFEQPEIRNNMNLVTGNIIPRFNLKKV